MTDCIYPETKRNNFYISGTRKETTFLKEDIFVSRNVWERKKETKVKETETSRNRPKFWERKSRFHYLCTRTIYIYYYNTFLHEKSLVALIISPVFVYRMFGIHFLYELTQITCINEYLCQEKTKHLFAFLNY